MNGFLKVIYNIIRGLFRIFFLTLLAIIIVFTRAITFEPGKKGEITVRKAKRIRFLSKIKGFILNVLPQNVVRYLGWDEYKDYFNKHIRNGLQLC